MANSIGLTGFLASVSSEIQLNVPNIKSKKPNSDIFIELHFGLFKIL